MAKDPNERTRRIGNNSMNDRKELVYILGLPKDKNSYVLHPLRVLPRVLPAEKYDRKWVRLSNGNEKEYDLKFGRIDKNLEKLIKEGKLSQEKIVEMLNNKNLAIGIYNDAVSSDHFSVGYKPNYGLQPEHFYVTDNGSTNGTHLSGIYYNNGYSQEGNFDLIPHQEFSLPEREGELAKILFGEKGLDVEFRVYPKNSKKK